MKSWKNKIYLILLVIFLGALFVQESHAATVSFDAAANSPALSNLTSGSWSHTTSGSNRYLVVGLSGWDDVSSITNVTVTYAGVSMTKLGGAIGAGGNEAVLWGLVNPALGTNTVQVSNIPASYSELAGGSVSFTGVNQTNSTGTLASGSTNSVQITLASGDMGVDIYYVGTMTGEPEPTPGANETQRASLSYYGGATWMKMGTEAGSGTVTMDWTTGPTSDDAIAAIPIKAATDITTGLIGYWKLNENPAIHGTTLVDDSGQGHNGTLSTNDGSTNKSVTGQIGQAIYFDGTDDYGYAPDVTGGYDFAVGASFTLSAWIKPTNLTNGQGIIIKQGPSGPNYAFEIALWGGGVGKLGLNEGGGGSGAGDVISAAGVTAGVWSHVAVVKNGTTITFYINGVSSAGDSSWDNLGPTTGYLTIGQKGSYLYSSYFNGLIDDARIYDSALTQADITELYNYNTSIGTTRFYFPSTGAADLSPTYSTSWHKTSNAQSSLALVTSKISSAFTTSASIITDTTSGARYMLARQYVSAPLAAQTIPAGTIKGQMKALESSTGLNATFAFNVSVCDSSGAITQTVLDIQASDATTTPPEFAAALTNRRFQNSAEATSINYDLLTVNQGDRLVIEIGYRKSNITASRYATFRYGDNSATDLGENNTDTADYCPWLEFNHPIVFLAWQVYYSVGQNTSNHGSGGTVDITAGVATFSTPQTELNLGVGDKVTYNTSNYCYLKSKDSTSQWSVVTATGRTPSDVADATVNSISHCFNSLSTALPFDSSGAKALLGTSDLVAGNYVLNIPCYNDAGAADTTTVTIDYWTEDADNYIRVYTPNNTSTECNQSQRHNGKWDDAKYRMLFSSGWIQTNYAISLRRPIKFEGIQFAVDPEADNRIIINVYWDDGGHDYIFDSCIFKSLDTDGTYYAKAFREGGHTGTAVNFKIYNCIFYDFVKTTWGNAIETESGCPDNFYIYNCTFNNNNTAVYQTAGTIIMKNCLFTGNNTADAYGTFAAGTDYNATNRASIGYTVTGGGNTNDRVSQTFNFVNAGGKDFHLAFDDAGAKDRGVDLSTDDNLAFSNDIDGESRPSGSAWDIGADERGGSQVYYSVGQNTNNMTGSPTLTISSGVATFTAAQMGNIGVGDRVTYTTLGAPQTNTYTTSGTWVCPAGVTSVQVEAWGGGGAGGGTTTDSTSKGGGGAGGQYAIKQNITVTQGNSYPYVVGAARAGTTGNGLAGNDSTFNTDVVVAKGGAGGLAYQNGGTAGLGSTANGVGDTVYAGGNGSNGAASSTGGAGGGGAGSGGEGGNASGNTAGTGTAVDGGNGGAGRTTVGAGNAGTAAGGGGGGGYTTTTTNRNGGTGARGQVKITYQASTSTVAYISGKSSSTQWTLVTKTGGTQADVGTAATVTSIAHEYISLSAAINGAFDSNHLTTGNLVTNNYVLNIPCYNDAGVADQTAVIIDDSNWTTGASNYIKIYTPSTSTECNQSQRHSGTWNTTKYRLEVSNNNVIDVYALHVRIDGLQIQLTSTSSWLDAIALRYSGAYYISNNILKGVISGETDYNRGIEVEGSGGLGSNGRAYIWNNIIYDFINATYGAVVIQHAGYDTIYAYNNIFYNNSQVFEDWGSGAVVKNNLSYNNTNNWYGGNYLSGSCNNLSGPGTDDYIPSIGAQNGVTVTFVAPTASPRNLHLDLTDSGAMEKGADLSADTNLAFYTDIDGEGRSWGSKWDIGADEYINLSPTAVGLVYFTARGQGASVLAEWETAQEISNLGFNLYRMAGANGSFTKLNKNLIPGLISSVKGRRYSYTDTGVTLGALCYYMLEDVDLSGKVTTHGPVCVDWDGDGIPDDQENKAADDEEDKDGSGSEKGQSPADWTPSPWDESASWVKIGNFRARQEADGVSLEWVTSFEADNLGFNIYREQDGKYYRITADLVPGSVFNAGAGKELPVGQRYVYFDALSDLTGQESYWLDCVGLDGARASFGPIKPEIDGKPVPERLKARFRSIAKHQVSREEKLGKILELRKELKSKETEMQASQAVFSSQTLISSFVPKSSEPRLPPSEAQWALAAKSAVKISVKEEGWYRVGQPELAAAGLDPLVDPRYLQLYVDGEEQSMMVSGSEDGRFDQEDAVEFYGKGLDTAFTDTRVYWLVVGSRPGRRLDTPLSDIRMGLDIKMLLSRGLRGRGAPLSFPYTVELKERTFYFAALKNGEEESFFGSVVYTEPVDQLINAPHPDPSAPDVARLEVVLQGATDFSHEVKVLFNNQEAGLYAFSGQQRDTIEIEIPHGLILDGENIVTLEAQGGSMDVSLVDYIRLTYWRTYTADEDSLKFTAMGTEWISIAGFSTEEIRVMDITDPAQMFDVEGRVKPEGSGYAITFKVPGHGQRKLFAFSEEKIKEPAGVAANTTSSWHERTQGADLVVISSRDFLESVRPLKELREQQGFTVVVVDVEDLYDEFNFGSKSPWPLREFLSRAYDRWVPAPRFVLLVGDASYDARNYLGFGDFDFVPTKYVETESIKTASDDWFVDFDDDGLPNMAVGRLPMDSAEEAETVVSKIISYEGATGFMNELLLVTDANDSPYDFEASSAEVAALLPQGMTVRQILRGQNPAARTDLLALLNQGQLVVNYIGHGSTEIWKGNLLTSSDAWDLTNSPYLPFLVSMTCLNGFFQDPASESMAETFLKAARGGAVGVWASSGLTSPPEQLPLDLKLIQLLFNGQGLTIGEAVALSKQTVINMDVRKTWILFGDPTTKLR
jgi:hypothetical protein